MSLLFGKKAEDMSSYLDYVNFISNEKPHNYLQGSISVRKVDGAVQRTVLNLHSELDFGRYIGKPVKLVAIHTPNYIAWMLENGVREFDKDCLDYFKLNGIS